MWNFDFQVEARHVLRDGIEPDEDGPTRSERIRALIANDRAYDSRTGEFGEGVQIDAHTEAIDRVRGAFAILLTSVGVPMILVGEEFAEIHDLGYENWQRKMEDPVDWSRREYPGHDALHDAVRDLIHLRTSTAALQRNEVEFFHVHPETDDPDGPTVVAYCRSGGEPVGSDDQVVVANLGPESFEAFEIPWTWGPEVTVRGAPLRAGDLDISPDEELSRVDLAPHKFASCLVTLLNLFFKHIIV